MYTPEPEFPEYASGGGNRGKTKTNPSSGVSIGGID
jgi:hypothetical protein